MPPSPRLPLRTARSRGVACAALSATLLFVASFPSGVTSFRAATVFAPSSVASAALTPKRHGEATHFKTAAEDATEVAVASADDAQALRQLTFLGLSAPTNEASPPEDGEDGDNNALDARNLSEFLMEIGACSVSITDADADTDDEEPLFDEPSPTACANDPREGDDGAELSEEWAMVIPDWAAGVSAGEIINVVSSSVGNFFPKSRGRQSCDAQAREQGAPLAGETGSLCVRGGRRK